MAGIPRPPTVSGLLTASSQRRFRYATGPTVLHARRDPAVMGPFNYVSQYHTTSSRSKYVKGDIVTLAGGMEFRKSTDYTTYSLSIPEDSSLYRADYFQTINVLRHYNRVAEGNGREVGTLVANPTDLVFGVGIPEELRAEAVTKALNKIADQKVNLGENLATAGQTARLFANYSAILAGALHFAKRNHQWRPFLRQSIRDLNKAGGVLSIAASQYLAYVYGLKPLVNDVYVGSELLKQKAAKSLILSGEGKGFRTQDSTPHKNWNHLSYSKYKVVSGSATCRARSKLWAQIDPNWQGIRALNQLGLLNPLSLAWELVSYSFVVDWFIPVGPALQALSAPAGLNFVDGFVSARTSESQTFEYAESAGVYDYDYAGYSGPKSETKLLIPRTFEGYRRDHLVSWPRPGLWVDPDPFRGDRVFKAIALSILALQGSRPIIR